MGGFSWLTRRLAAAGDPTHALFAAQSHSIVDNLVALFEHSRAWNCSGKTALISVAHYSVHSRCRVPTVLLNLAHSGFRSKTGPHMYRTQARSALLGHAPCRC